MRSASVHTPTHTHTRAHNDALAQSRNSTYMLVPVTAAVPPLHARTYYTHVPLAKTVALAGAAHAHNQRTYVHTHTLTRSSSHYVLAWWSVGRAVCGASRREASSENSRLTRASKYRRRTLKSARNATCVCVWRAIEKYMLNNTRRVGFSRALSALCIYFVYIYSEHCRGKHR